MFWYIFKFIVLLLFSLFVGLNYYFVFSGHLYESIWLFTYIIFLVIFYWIYKTIKYYQNKEQIKISFKEILVWFLINLFFLSFYYFSLAWYSISYGFTLFIKVIFYSLFPILFYFIITGFWEFLYNKIIKENRLELWNASFLLSLIIWFISFIFLLTIFALFWLYNIFVVLALLLVFSVFWYKDIIKLWTKLWNYELLLENKTIQDKTKNIFSEIFTLIIFFVLWMALIWVVKPFPIWWDDSWAYMNFPNLIANSKDILSLWWFYSWQIFTWIWYLFHSPNLAFFLNISGLFLVFFALLFTIFDLLDSSKKTILPINIILSLIYISLPMVIFHSVKDMKLDEWLLFISIIWIYVLLKYILALKEDKKISLIYIFLIWIIFAFAFSVKVTSLMLIISAIWVLSFFRLSFSGFLWVISIIFSVFSFWNLWSLMNVIINPSNIEWLENKIWLWFLVLWIIFLVFSVIKNKKNLIIYFKEIVLFSLWILLFLFPWFWKNILETYPNISVSWLLNWKTEIFRPNYTSIYSETEIKEIQESYNKSRQTDITANTNEDLMRYLWYENGILNYVKIFWNLTMQKNQGWEFTTIWWLFFAFLPLIFIFFPYKRKEFFIFFIVITSFQFLYFSLPNYKIISKEKLSWISEESLNQITSNNENVFLDLSFNKDVYDIKETDYIYRETLIEELKKDNIVISEATNLAIEKGLNNINDEVLEIVSEKYYDIAFKQVRDNFYLLLTNMVKREEINSNFELTLKDLKYIDELSKLYEYKLFLAEDIVDFKKLLNNSSLSQEEKDIALKVWSENRTFIWKLNDKLATTTFPVWYLYLISLLLFPLIYLLYTLKNSNKSYLIKLVLVMTSIYVLLWWISSFWIVWYWIVMYYLFILLISLGLYYFSCYKEWDKQIEIKFYTSIIFLLLLSFYIIVSVIPYIISVAKDDPFADYKWWIVSSSRASFEYYPDNLIILYELNIDDNKKLEFLEKNIDTEYHSLIQKYSTNDIESIVIELKKLENNWLIKAKKSINNIYEWITNPSENFRNKWNIYWSWTFLKYYVSENNRRLLDDQLLYTFDYYIYYEDKEDTIDRLKSLWISYMVIDLNWATIDNSLNHDLTNRYEKLLYTLNADNLELLYTDSLCLRVAIEDYNYFNDKDKFFSIAWVNYESYTEAWEKILRGDKFINCLDYLVSIINSNEISEKRYSYLLTYKEYFKDKNVNLEELVKIINRWWKAIFKIK